MNSDGRGLATFARYGFYMRGLVNPSSACRLLGPGGLVIPFLPGPGAIDIGMSLSQSGKALFRDARVPGRSDARYGRIRRAAAPVCAHSAELPASSAGPQGQCNGTWRSDPSTVSGPKRAVRSDRDSPFRTSRARPLPPRRSPRVRVTAESASCLVKKGSPISGRSHEPSCFHILSA